jgi:hypothetical protein
MLNKNKVKWDEIMYVVCSLQAPNCIHHFTNSVVIFSINFDFNIKDLFVSNDPFPVDTYRIQ